ncbi:MAG: acyl-CoA dehydrogenase family protein, partial [Nocardioides sp.]|uniref:acyl-CoA dehydrogenase family protein n=1 Tax=Nocardioides sp. TaxID=35761 RepID=UPI0039E53C92
MSLAITEEHRDLAAAVTAFVAGEAPLAATRAELEEHAAGRPAKSWDRLVAQGFHAVHLPEEVGGDGAGLTELAVIAEALAHGLFPGPFLTTVRAGAVLTAAPASPARDRALRT